MPFPATEAVFRPVFPDSVAAGRPDNWIGTGLCSATPPPCRPPGPRGASG